MVPADADDDAEMRRAHPEGSGRKPPEQGMGASIATARSQPSPPEVEVRLMEEIVSRANMMAAYHRVMTNKGAAGIDRMAVEQLQPHLKEHWPRIKEELLEGRYRPQPVRGVEIPKPGGGMRQLGIPTVVDRLIQQAMHQVLMPLFDPDFSEASYGFRPGRSAHGAVLAAQAHVAEGRRFVVDLDLEKFFDRVNHDILMARLARRVADKRLLRIVRRFLEAGLMQNGVCIERHEGTPQGGPLSPLLANLLLDDLDKELERRGHCFCRYADDCNIYVQSKAAGGRVLASVTQFLEGVLRLQVNREKSAVAYIEERKFLGHRLLGGGKLGIAPKSLARAKERIREISRRNRGISLDRMIRELNSFLTGWVTYYRYAECKSHLAALDGWIRRKLRCVRLKHCKRTKTIADFLSRLGVATWNAWCTALSGKGWWRLADSPSAKHAMSNQWFEGLGLVNLVQRYVTLQT